MTLILRNNGERLELATCRGSLNRPIEIAGSSYERMNLDKALSTDRNTVQKQVLSKIGKSERRKEIQSLMHTPVHLLPDLKDILTTKLSTQWNWLRKFCKEAVIVDDDPKNAVVYLLIPEKALDKEDPVQLHRYLEDLANNPDIKDRIAKKFQLKNVGLVTFLIEPSADSLTGRKDPLGINFDRYDCVPNQGSRLEILGASGKNSATPKELQEFVEPRLGHFETLRAADSRRILASSGDHMKWVLDHSPELLNQRQQEWDAMAEALSGSDRLQLNPIKDPGDTIRKQWESMEVHLDDNLRRFMPRTTTPGIVEEAKHYHLKQDRDHPAMLYFEDTRENTDADSATLMRLDNNREQLEYRLPFEVQVKGKPAKHCVRV